VLNGAGKVFMASEYVNFFEKHLSGSIVELTLAGLLSYCGYEVIRYGYEHHLSRTTKDLSLIANDHGYHVRSAPDFLIYDLVVDENGNIVKSKDHFCRLIEVKSSASDKEWSSPARGYNATWIATKNAIDGWRDSIFAVYSRPLGQFFCIAASEIGEPTNCIAFSEMKPLSEYVSKVTKDAEAEFVRRLLKVSQQLAKNPAKWAAGRKRKSRSAPVQRGGRAGGSASSPASAS
jgi:hypothetical protein